MGRYVGLIINKGKGGGGLGPTEPFSRASGITTDSNNNVTAVTLGDTAYSAIQYDAQASTVGLITGFTENIGGVSKKWKLTYDSNTNLVTNVEEDLS
jgi:hypothetical protein|tara:strand:+ start:55 stop:345 length:291 start_codon:yes stop_codon:yes gene_type:complete